MRCGSCQSDNREDVRFCEECGAPLVRSCPRCGAQVQPGKRFCGECGTQLLESPAAAADRDVPDSERKRVTVIFCDIVNSTGLPSGWAQRPCTPFSTGSSSWRW